MIGSVLSGRYEVTGELGRGGMGVVYTGVDPLLNREVAIKMISPTLVDSDAERRIEHEAQTVARLEHPAIVPIHDMGRHQNGLYLVMPLVRGETLRSLIDRRELRLGDILEVGVQGAQALGYSHSQGVVHRDIKPSNLLISRQGGRLRLRILDFGLARRYDRQDLTRSTRVAGTLSYLSPEQVESGGRKADGRSDLYSLGAVLYECLAGEPPFVGSLFATLYRIVHDPPAGLRERGALLDEELEAIVLRCLQKDPASRPTTGKELAAELARYRDRLAESEWARRTSTPTEPAKRILGQPEEPLIGREEELAKLEERLAQTAAGECGFVLLAGDAGTGKTRLGRELEGMARDRGFLVLHGRFSELEMTFPHQAFCELIEDFYRLGESTVGDQAPPDLSDLAPDLVTLYPALAEIPDLAASGGLVSPGTPPATPPPAGSDRSREETQFFELLSQALQRLAAGRPMVLVLEDLHAGDSGLHGLQYLIRRLGAARALVLGTARLGQVDRGHPLIRVLAGFEGDPRFLRLDLGPLDHRGLREIAEGVLGGPALDAELVERLWQATEGNPLFCRELLRSLVETGTLVHDEIGLWTLTGEAGALPEAMPVTLRQAEERRLEQLGDGDRRLLTTAAVLGRTFEIQDLVALLGEREELEDQLDLLVERGFLREVRKSRGERLSFTSGIVRELLEQELTRRRRRRLHEAYVRRLETRFDGQLERVYPRLIEHCRAADLPDETVRYAMALAERSLATSSAEDAARAARVALEFAEDADSRDFSMAAAQDVLARAYALLGQGDRVVRHAEEAARRWGELGEPARQAAAALVAADMAWRHRRMEEVRRWVTRGLEASRGGVAPETLDRLTTLGITVANLHGERSEALYLEEVRAQELQCAGEQVLTLPGGTLKVALPFKVRSIDPCRLLTREEFEIASNVYEPLLATDGQGLLVPRLCETWRASPDHRTFSLLLRGDLSLSDGTPFDAVTLKQALERCARNSLGDPPPALAAVVGIEDFMAGSSPHLRGLEVSVDVGGRQRLRFRLHRSLPIFPHLLTDPSTAIARPVEGELLGTGPFRLDFHSEDSSRWRLSPNPCWRGQAPAVDGLEFRLFDEPWALSAAFSGGEVDLAGDLPADDLEELVRQPGMRAGLAETPKKNVYLLLFRHARVEDALRRAMFGVVRVRDLVWQNVGRYAVPATGLVPPGVIGHDAAADRRVISIERANEMLEAAGVERPRRLRTVVHPHFHGRFTPVLRGLIALWSQLGIELEIVSHDMDSFRRTWSDPEVELLIGRWGAAYEDPDNFTHFMLNSRTGVLRGFYGSADADLLLERARLETRASARQALYRRFESFMEEESVLLPLFHEVDFRLLHPSWGGLHLSSAAPYVDYLRISRRAEAPGGVETSQGELRVAQTSMLNSLDPAAANGLEHHELVGNVFETLTRVNEQAKVEPWLAESIEPLLGGRSFRIRLRPNVRFHDGRQLTARDVRFSFERLLREDSELRYLTAPLRGSEGPPPQAGAPEAGAGGPSPESMASRRRPSGTHPDSSRHLAGLVLRSPLELILELRRRMPTFPARLAHPGLAIVPEGSEGFAGSYREGCCGTGPFRVTAFEPGESVRLERHPLYWRSGIPKVEKLEFVHLPNPQRRLNEFRAGRLSLLTDLPAIDAERLRRESDPGAYHETPSLMTYFVALNRRRGPLVDRDLRAALLAGLDLGTATRSLGRLAVPARSLVPPGLLAYEPSPRSRRPEVDLEAWSDLRLTLACHPAFSGRYGRLKEALVGYLEQLGVRVEVLEEDLRSLHRRGQSGEVDLVLSRWGAVYPDADCFFTGLFSLRGGFLSGMMGGEDIQGLIDEAGTEADAALRHGVFRRLEDLLAEQSLVAPIFHEQVYRFAQPDIESLRLAVTAPQVRYEEIAVTSKPWPASSR